METKEIMKNKNGQTLLNKFSPKRRAIAVALVCLAGITSLVGVGTPQVRASTGAGMPSAALSSIDAPNSPGPFSAPGAPEAAVGTAFTYQGRLVEGGNPANGQYDFRFTLFDALSGGNQIGSPVSVSAQTVTQGLFTVSLDFGAAAFAGDARYLQLEVRQTGGGTYTLLSPRQPITPAPYALGLSPGAVVSGGVSGSILSLTNTTSQGIGLLGYATNGSTAKGVYGESVDGYGGYFQSTNGDGLSATGADGIDATGTAADGSGVRGTNNNGSAARGVLGISTGGSGVYGTSTTGYGGNFSSTSGTGVTATGGNGISSTGTASNGVGVSGTANSGTNAKGVYGTSSSGFGVYGTSSAGAGIYGASTASNGKGVYGVANTGSTASGVYGSSTAGYGVYASGGTGVYATGGNGIYSTGTASNGAGVWGVANSGLTAKGVYGTSSSGYGVYGTSTATNSFGVVGVANTGTSPSGVYGSSTSNTGYGVKGVVTTNGTYAAGVLGSAGGTGNFGVEGISDIGSGIYGSTTTGWAGYFHGNVHVSGSCCGAGDATNQIDDPLDPQNKFLNQALIQSPDMLSLVDGNITTDANGEATVQLPDYFEAANTDFRYQLTVMGQFAQAIISEKIKDNHFSIKTDKPNVEVSWQVTAVRQDPYALAHPLQTEPDKPASEQGKYLYPQLYGQPDSLGIDPSSGQTQP